MVDSAGNVFGSCGRKIRKLVHTLRKTGGLGLHLLQHLGLNKLAWRHCRLRHGMHDEGGWWWHRGSHGALYPLRSHRLLRRRELVHGTELVFLGIKVFLAVRPARMAVLLCFMSSAMPARMSVRWFDAGNKVDSLSKVVGPREGLVAVPANIWTFLSVSANVSSRRS